MNRIKLYIQNIIPKVFSKNTWKSFLILIIGIVLTFAATIYTKNEFENHLKHEFAFVCSDIKTKIVARLYSHAQLLRSGSSFFAASDTITRKDWKIFDESSKLNKNLPGIQGFGFSLIIKKEQLQQHIQHIRNEGFSDYTVRPAGDREVYSSIIFLEPFADKNLRAFGYDMYSEPIRKKAMERARDYDIAALSGKVVLVQETGKDLQAGTLMYVPVYQKRMPTNTIEQRRAAIIGWVYSPYRMVDLMQGILGVWDFSDNNRIHLQIYDNDSISLNSLLFDSQNKDTIGHNDNHYQTLAIPIVFNEKKWTLLFSRSNQQFSYFQSKTGIVLVGGFIISLLLFSLSLLLFKTRVRAQFAEQLTSELTLINKELIFAKEKEEESEEKFRTLAENSPVIIYKLLLQPTFKFDYVSPAVTVITGYTPEEHYADPNLGFKLVHPEDRKILENATKKIQGEPVVLRWIRKDGKIIWTEQRNVLIFDKSGNPYSIEGIAMDISAQKDAEFSLQISEDKYRISEYDLKKAQSVAHLGNWKWDLETREVTWSDEMFQIFGIDKKFNTERLGDIISKVIHPDDLYMVLPENAVTFANKKQQEYRIILPDKSMRYILAEAGETILDDTGKPSFLTGIALDITERKLTEIELMKAKEIAEENNAIISAIIENTKDSIWSINSDYKITYLNQVFKGEFYNTFGIKLEIGDYVIYNLPEPLQEQWKKHYERVFKNEQFAIIDKVEIEQDTTLYVQMSMNPIVVSGKVIGASFFGSDITDRKLQEQELLKAKEKAEESDRLKTQFLLNMSHEIKTPMNAINGFSNLLNKPDLSDEKRKSFTSIIINSSNQLQSIVENILTISALETKVERTIIQPVSINSIIVDLLAIFKTQASNHNISLYSKQELTDKQSEIYTDKTKVTQILTNLISNAIKFTHEGYVEFGYNLKNNELEFYVKDTGIGIKPELQEKIFERFIQVEMGLTRRYGGNGLGLAISKGFVELLGGKFWLHSEIEKGSTFYFSIPYKHVHEIEKINITSKQNADKTTVLIAEDEEYNFLYIEEMLINKDFRLIHAKDGQEAVDICKTNSEINLILMDIKMPVMDGHEAAKQIKEFRPELIIIAQSAYTLEEFIEKYHDNPFDDYISKPLNEDEFIQKIMKYIDKQKDII